MDNVVSGNLAAPPSPPSEVKIRTMRSDLQSMAKSGGGLPAFQNVKVSGLATGSPRISVTSVARTESKINLLAIVLAVIILALLAVGSWFVYENFFANGGGGGAGIGSQNSQAQNPPIRQPAPAPSPAQAQSNQMIVPTSSAPAPAPSSNASSGASSGGPPILKLGN